MTLFETDKIRLSLFPASVWSAHLSY